MTEDQRQRILDGTVRCRQIAVANPARRQANGHFAVARRFHLDLLNRDCFTFRACNHCPRPPIHFATSIGKFRRRKKCAAGKRALLGSDGNAPRGRRRDYSSLALCYQMVTQVCAHMNHPLRIPRAAAVKSNT